METKTIQTIETGIYHIPKITKKDPVITQGTETTSIETDSEIFYSQPIEIRINIQFLKVKSADVELQNIKDKIFLQSKN